MFRCSDFQLGKPGVRAGPAPARTGMGGDAVMWTVLGRLMPVTGKCQSPHPAV